MDIKEFAELLKAKSGQIDDLLARKMPVFTGRLAKDHYQDNFRKSGFVNRGLNEWLPAKRLNSGATSAAANYGTLLSGRNHLFSSTNYSTSPYRTVVFNNVPYASAHNHGETVHPTVTPRMRRFAWAKYYEASGGGKKGTGGRKKGKNSNQTNNNDAAQFWKNFALTKKKKLSIKMPLRPFIGESEELNEKIISKHETELRKILNS
ncbi:hypothetical protein [Parabacteroides sp. PF5-9]|uniref:hypothetical protein n=1 Tax=Parabacteroides sp. PF5-9 TaxID=1742404 RepID=UPI0024753495|nr:hypothetical protein [Parabacteroides sp. PF5-9]MDH6357231.1 phage gpG-like protein [Parabacteroides sp. PF5-9]